MRFLALRAAVLITALLLTAKGGASGIDLHWLWDNQCAQCHGHSGEFSRKFLQATNGQLRGIHHAKDLRIFLRKHYTRSADVDAIYEMLLAQAQTRPRFKQECANCHGSAASFVRHSIILQDGALLNRESGQPVRQFLRQHRQLGVDDVDFFSSLLNRIAHEVYRP